MKTNLTFSKLQKYTTTCAASVGSIAIIGVALALALNNLPNNSASYANSIVNSEPTRSDPRSDQDPDYNNSTPSGGDNNNQGVGDRDDSQDDEDDSKNNVDNGDNDKPQTPTHGEPCLDPNCPVHHPSDKPSGGDDNSNTDDKPSDNTDAPPVDISMNIIRFKGDSAEYVDEKAAQDILLSYLAAFENYFEVYPDGVIYLAGGVARTHEAGHEYDVDIVLSQQRADAVRNSFIKLGVDEDKLIAIGMGSRDPWHNDEYIDGVFTEDIAKTNRRVWIIPDAYKAQVEAVLAIPRDDIIEE